MKKVLTSVFSKAKCCPKAVKFDTVARWVCLDGRVRNGVRQLGSGRAVRYGQWPAPRLRAGSPRWRHVE